MPVIKAIAMYLPQFHPIPENDRWWGKGFTEWTNVTRAVPQFPGHAQPHLPADLGFYDLRLPESREQQAELARHYGIHGFCYYHYWLHGRRLLHRPIDEVLETGQPRFPFCLCWANHNWTRNWDDSTRELLIEQRYSLQDHLEHFRWLARVFLDDRYIRVDGKPLFLILRASAVRHLDQMVDLWREQAHRLGVGELFLAEFESPYPMERADPRRKGLDAVVEFQPDFFALLGNAARCALAEVPSLASGAGDHGVNHHVFDYEKMVRLMLAKERPPYRMFPSVTPSWDNTPRLRNQAIIVHGSTPQVYESWLGTMVKEELAFGTGDRVVFLNAWNEWAEGNHLEPCRRWGHAYLEATRRALGMGAVIAETPAVRASA